MAEARELYYVNPSLVKSLPKTGRVRRNPTHTFQLRTNPWQIQPFMLAPVLPGETLKNLLLQARVVTSPIKNPLIGWWTEYYFFYVKHRDLADRDEFVQMHLDIDWTITNVDEPAASTAYYHSASSINWSKLCLTRVIEEYFRNEGEAWDAYTINSMPIAKASDISWWDNLTKDVDMPATDVEPGNLDTQEEYDALRAHYEYLQSLKLTAMDFDDYLATFGIKQPAEELAEEDHRPELLRFVREWAYPANTVDPTSGGVSSAVSWAIRESADKSRFFKEPGFLFGVTVCRPKVYYSKQTGSAAEVLDNAFAWLPAVLKDEAYTSLKKLSAGAGPVPTIRNDADTANEPYWIDVRDLFLYGDQFVNFALTETDAGLVALPDKHCQRHYPSSTDMEGLFSGSTAATRLVKQDGVVALSILGTQMDMT